MGLGMERKIVLLIFMDEVKLVSITLQFLPLSPQWRGVLT
jgi:hypothetical protein